MKTRELFIIGALATACAGACAQVPQILAEACALLDPPPRRAECLRVAAGVTGASSTAPAYWADLDKAFVSILGAADAGAISWVQHNEMLLNVTRELMVVKSKAPAEHREAIEMLERAHDDLLDANVLWREEISFFARSGNRQAYSGMLPIKLVGLERLVGKYSLPTQKADLWGLYQGIDTHFAKKMIWRSAQTHVGMAGERFKALNKAQ